MKIIFLLSLGFACSIVFAQNYETVEVPLPEDERWAIAHQQDAGKEAITEYLRPREKLTKWKQMYTIHTLRGIRIPGFPRTLTDGLLKQAQLSCPSIRQTMIDSFEIDGYPAIVYKMECSNYTNSSNSAVKPGAESQLWMLVQGARGIYMCQAAIKADVLPDDFVEKWRQLYRKARLRQP